MPCEPDSRIDPVDFDVLSVIRAAIDQRALSPPDPPADRIPEGDWWAAYPDHPALAADEVLLQAGQRVICRGDLYTIALVYGLDAIAASELAWQIGEGEALARFQTDVPPGIRHRFLSELKADPEEDSPGQDQAIRALWLACLWVLQLDHHPPEPEALDEPVTGEDGPEAETVTGIASRLLDECWQSLATRHTLRTLMQTLTGQDLLDRVRGELIRFSAAHLDAGEAVWTDPGRDRGMYINWREGQGSRWPSLPASSVEAVHQELGHLGIAPAQWADYLQRLALELPDWADRFNRSAPGALMDFLALRLLLDRQAFTVLCRETWPVSPTLPALYGYFSRHGAEFFVRQILHQSSLPEHLVIQARQARDWNTVADRLHAWQRRSQTTRMDQCSPHRDGWRLFRLTQHLGLTANEVQSVSQDTAHRLLETLNRLTPDIEAQIRASLAKRDIMVSHIPDINLEPASSP